MPRSARPREAAELRRHASESLHGGSRVTSNPRTPQQIGASNSNLLFPWGMVTNRQVKAKGEGDDTIRSQKQGLPGRLQPERRRCPLRRAQLPGDEATEGLPTWQTAPAPGAGSAGAGFGSGSDPSAQPPVPARRRHTRELRVSSFPVVK